MGCSYPWVPRLIWFLTLLTLVYIGWVSTKDPEGLWAPGDLSRFHTDIETCVACHTPFRGPTLDKCIVCHSIQQFQVRAHPEVGREHQAFIRELKPCSTCHMEHRGVLAAVTVGWFGNPHGEFIFRVTGANSCSDCHLMKAQSGKPGPILLNNSRVKHLVHEGEGAHQVGGFADCLRCHKGGRFEVDEQENKDDNVDNRQR